MASGLTERFVYFCDILNIFGILLLKRITKQKKIAMSIAES